MIVDFSTAALPDRIEADVAIVGSGLAAAAVASRLTGAGRRIVILE